MKMYWKSSEMFRKCIEKFKCSCNLCVTKVDNNLEITSVHFSLDFGNKIWIGKPFINMVCHFKTLHLGCPFMPPVSFEIVYCRFFWSDFSSFLLSDYTSLIVARVALDLSKDLAILSDTAVRRSAVDREDLKPYWKWQKGHISTGDQWSYYLQVFWRLY